MIAAPQAPGPEQSKAHAPVVGSQAPPARAQVVHAFDRAAPPAPSIAGTGPPIPPVPGPPAPIPPAEACGSATPPAPTNGSRMSVGPPASTSDESPIVRVPPVPIELGPPPLAIPPRSTALPEPPPLLPDESARIPTPTVPPAPLLRPRPDLSTRQPANAITARNPPREVPWNACLIVYHSRRDSVRCQSHPLRGPCRWRCFRRRRSVAGRAGTR